MRIRVDGLSFSYRSSFAVKGVSLELRKSELLGIIGPNGSGKSTLLKCINRILEPRQGLIELDGKNLRSMSRTEIARVAGYVPQNHILSQDGITAFEVVLMGRRPYTSWRSSEDDAEAVWRAIGMLGLEEIAMRNFYELSGGEQQKVLIARAIAQEAKVLLLDEPTSNLDIKHQLEVMDIIKKLVSGDGISAIVVMHDLNLASRYCDKVIMMKNGSIFAAGPPGSVLVSENIATVYGIRAVVNRNDNITYIIPVEAI